MHPSFRALAGQARQPLIKFIGKRTHPNTHVTTPHPHPAAPAETRNRFAEFVKKFQSSKASPSSETESRTVSREFWEAPEHLWKQNIGEVEIEAILSGGASLHR